MLEIHGGATSRALRAHWTAHEVGVEYRPVLIGSRTGETKTPAFRRLNPKEKIPVLKDGTFVLTESYAIVNYLIEHYGSHTTLLPEPHSLERARYDEWCAYVLMELDAHTLYVMRKHRDLADLYGEAPAAIREAIAGFEKQVRVAEARVGTSDHLLDTGFSGADILLTTCLDWAVFYGFTLAPALNDYRERQRARPAFRTAARLNFSISAGA